MSPELNAVFPTFSEPLLRRICGEFLEMPGLQLTFPQARRLWALDDETCTGILELLVEIKFLRLTGLDTYARLTEGPVALRLLVAKAKFAIVTRSCDEVMHSEMCNS